MKKETKRNLAIAIAIGAGVGIFKALTDHTAEKKLSKQMEEVEKVIRDDQRKMAKMAMGSFTERELEKAKSVQDELDDMVRRRKEEGEKRLKELREEMEALHEEFMETDDVSVMLDITKKQDKLIKELRDAL